MVAATQPSGGTSYSAEATALFARMSVAPDATRKGHINTLIVDLKSAGVWTKLDAFYVLAAHDAQAARLNWIGASYDATAVNSPTFTTDRGYTGDGATSYLDTSFNPTTAASPKFTRNSAHVGVWMGTDVSSSTQIDFGNLSARIISRSAGTALLRLNSSGVSYTLPASTSIGHTLQTRTDATNLIGYKNGGSAATIAAASSAPSNANFMMLAVSAASSFSTRREQAAHYGSYLDATEALATYNALSTYMQAVGAA